MTRLVVGLGNPGPEYAGTRHNVGFEVVDHLATHEGVLFRSHRSLDGYGGPGPFQWARSFDPDALLLKPETFMNLSGRAVEPVARWLQGLPRDSGPTGRSGDEEGEPEPAIDSSRILVVYDDLDLPVGKLRIRARGSGGGQKGMRSILMQLGTDECPRLRVGIGRPRTDAARHVLEPFDEDERTEIDISIAEASEAVLAWLLEGDLEKCMTRFHSRWSQSG